MVVKKEKWGRFNRFLLNKHSAPYKDEYGCYKPKELFLNSSKKLAREVYTRAVLDVDLLTAYYKKELKSLGGLNVNNSYEVVKFLTNYDETFYAALYMPTLTMRESVKRKIAELQEVESIFRKNKEDEK